MPDETVELEVEVIESFGFKAMKCVFADSGESAWIPLSLISDPPGGTGLSEGDTEVTITIPRWKAEEERLIE